MSKKIILTEVQLKALISEERNKEKNEVVMLNESDLRKIIHKTLLEHYEPEDSYPYYGAKSTAVIVLSNNEPMEYVDILYDIPDDADTEKFTYVEIVTTDFNHTRYERNDGDYYNEPYADFYPGTWEGGFEIQDIYSDNEDANEVNDTFTDRLNELISQNYDSIEKILQDNADLIED